MPSPPKPLRFYAELYVERPPWVVWSFFSDLTRWNQWSPICLESRLVEDGRLETGAVLEIRFSIGGIPVTVPAKLVYVKPASAISWLGHAFGIRAIHTYRFRAQQTGTLITNEEVFYEVAAPFNHLIAAWYRMSRLSFASLDGIKRVLEQETD
ncbi:MAG TPA: SRPBCC family protein [Pyrinomonadaceae bacterium]|jgi:ligand-binding SRPBCC domain-containing protein|nr:SRPBCC family protein [Pyrinomonadaceae bacterium]